MSHNLDKYFIWERPSFPGLVYIAAEACVLSHIEHFDYPWDDTLCFFSNGLVRGVWHKDKMVENGIKITNNFLEPKYYKEKMEVYSNLTKELSHWFNKLEKNNWQNLSDKDFLQLSRNYNKDFLSWWGFAQVSDMIGMGAEALLKKAKDLSNEQIGILTATTYKSYTTEEDEEILQIIKQILSNKNLTEIFRDKKPEDINEYLENNELEIYQSFVDHTNKYFWLLNSYAETKKLDVKHFISVVKELLSHADLNKEGIIKIISDNSTRLEEFKQKIKALESELNFDEREKKLVQFIDYFTFFQDERKAISLQANYYSDQFIRELARRSNSDYDLIKFLTPQEYGDLLDGKLDSEIFNERKKHFSLLFWETGLEILQGEESKKKEEELLGKVEAENISEFEGTRAMGGRVVGKVRKIMHLEEMDTIQDGEILVTSMTTPDFIGAMKKAMALITDQGGVTCHAAVISRELNIPCVIGTKIATRVLNTGDLVEVRANHGLVKILKKN